jgi:hypothetical protein
VRLNECKKEKISDQEEYRLTCVSDYHDRVPRILRFVELNNLGDDYWNFLESVSRYLGLNGGLEVPIVEDRGFYPRE